MNKQKDYTVCPNCGMLKGFINYKYDNYLQYKQYILVNSKAAKYKDIKKRNIVYTTTKS